MASIMTRRNSGITTRISCSMKTLHGNVHGKTIELVQGLGMFASQADNFQMLPE
jgi:hypothetical protein